MPSAAELETALGAAPFTPPPLPDLDDLLPQRDTRDEQALRHQHAQLADAYQVARIPPEHIERMRPQDHPPGREHLPPPEVDEHGGSLAWFTHRELPDTVMAWATVMDRAARRTAEVNDAIAASEDGSYWADE